MPFSWFKKSVDFSAGQTLTDKECFYVITAVFNPVGFHSRYTLYHNFAEHMKASGAQLITIECIFPSLNQHDFQVTNSTNPMHIQMKSESVYWMKEDLINIAVSRLPPHAKWVCWLDGDIEFESKKWVELTIKELKKYAVVQMFKKAKFLGPNSNVLRTDYSFGYSVVQHKPIDQNRYDEWYPHPGYGWAMSVKDFRDMNGLPDYDIIGSGDLHFAFSLLNKVSNALEDQLNLEFKKLILNHSNLTFFKLHQLCSSNQKEMVGYLPVTIKHNWHGSRKDRQYVNRWMILIAHDFNFLTDVKRNEIGLLTLNPDKPGLQRDILQHFQKRKEDTTTIDLKEDKNEIAKPESEKEGKKDKNGKKDKDKGKDDKKNLGKPPKEPKDCKCDDKKKFKKEFPPRTRQSRDEDSMIVFGGFVNTQPPNQTSSVSPDDYYHTHQDNSGFCYEGNYNGAFECTTRY